MASAEYKNRYYMFYTTSTAAGAVNDHAVVYNQNQKWELDDNITAASAALYQNALYLGDSQATGTVYLYDTGSADNGQAYGFSFTTPDMDGGDPIAPKQWQSLYLVVGAQGVTTSGVTLNCSYTLDGSTDTYSFNNPIALNESPTQNGYFVAKVPFPSNQPTTSNWLNINCGNVGASGPIRIYQMRVLYTPDSWP